MDLDSKRWLLCPRHWIVLCLCAGPALAVAATGGPAVEEYALKAAVIFNLAKFVEWPPGTFRDSREPIGICILGDNPFGDSLEQAVSGKAIDNRPLRVRQISDASQAAACHMLFVSSSERKRFGAVLGELKSSTVLTVGDADGFVSEGGVVNLRVEGGRIRIQINLDAAEQQRLRISSRLLSLAEVVRK